jgi:hypothetical protein
LQRALIGHRAGGDGDDPIAGRELLSQRILVRLGKFVQRPRTG